MFHLCRIEIRVCVYHIRYLVSCSVFISSHSAEFLVQPLIYTRYPGIHLHCQAAIEAILFITPGLHMRVRRNSFVLIFRSSMLCHGVRAPLPLPVTYDTIGPSGVMPPPCLAGCFSPRAVGSQADQGGANAAAPRALRQQVIN